MSENNCTSNFVMGTLIGGALAGVATLLLAPKSGCDLREDISDKLSEKYSQFADSWEDYSPRRMWAPEPETNHTSLVVGGLVGGLVAAAAALLLAPKAGSEICKDLAKLSESGTDQVREFVDGITNRRKSPLHHVRQRLRRK